MKVQWMRGGEVAVEIDFIKARELYAAACFDRDDTSPNLTSAEVEWHLWCDEYALDVFALIETLGKRIAALEGTNDPEIPG